MQQTKRGKKIKIVIPMPPVSKGRPRFANGHAYTPAKTRQYEEAVQIIARNAINLALIGAIKLHIYFYMPIPKSWSKPKKRRAMEGEIRPTTRPDIDNLVKAILDSLNGGIGYNDDSQIVELHVEEWYGEPRTEIELEEL